MRLPFILYALTYAYDLSLLLLLLIIVCHHCPTSQCTLLKVKYYNNIIIIIIIIIIMATVCCRCNGRKAKCSRCVCASPGRLCISCRAPCCSNRSTLPPQPSMVNPSRSSSSQTSLPQHPPFLRCLPGLLLSLPWPQFVLQESLPSLMSLRAHKTPGLVSLPRS